MRAGAAVTCASCFDELGTRTCGKFGNVALVRGTGGSENAEQCAPLLFRPERRRVGGSFCRAGVCAESLPSRGVITSGHVLSSEKEQSLAKRFGDFIKRLLVQVTEPTGTRGIAAKLDGFLFQFLRHLFLFLLFLFLSREFAFVIRDVLGGVRFGGAVLKRPPVPHHPPFRDDLDLCMCACCSV